MCPAENSSFPRYRLRPLHVRCQPFTPSKSLVILDMWQSQLQDLRKPTPIMAWLCPFASAKSYFPLPWCELHPSLSLPNFTNSNTCEHLVFPKTTPHLLCLLASKKSAHSLKQNTTDLCPPAHLSKLAHYNARPDIKARSITLLPSPHRLLLCTRILKIPDTQFMGFLCFSSKTPQNLSMCRFPSSFPSISELRRDKYFVSSSTRSSDYQNRFCTKSWIVKYEKRRSMCLLSPAAVSALKTDS